MPHAIIGYAAEPPGEGDAGASFAAEVSRLSGLGNLLMSSDLMSQAKVSAANGSGVDTAAQEIEGSAAILSPNNPYTNGNCVVNGGLNGGYPLLQSTLGRDYSTVVAAGGYGAVADVWILDTVNTPVYDGSTTQVKFEGVDVTAEYPVGQGFWVVRTDTYEARGKSYINTSTFTGVDTVLTLSGASGVNAPMQCYKPRDAYVYPESQLYTPAFEGGSFQGTHLPLHRILGSSNNSIGGGDDFSWTQRNVSMCGIRFEFRIESSSFFNPPNGSNTTKFARISCAKNGDFLEDRWMDIRCRRFSSTEYQFFPWYAYGPGFDLPGYEPSTGNVLDYIIPVSLAGVWLRCTLNGYYDRVEFDLRRVDTGAILHQATSYATTIGYKAFTRKSAPMSITSGGTWEPNSRNEIEGNVSGAKAIVVRDWSDGLLDSGSWSLGTAASTSFYVRDKTGTFNNGETVTIRDLEGGSVVTSDGFTVTTDPGAMLDQNYLSSFAFNQHSSSIATDDPGEPEFREKGIRYVVLSGDSPVVAT